MHIIYGDEIKDSKDFENEKKKNKNKITKVINRLFLDTSFNFFDPGQYEFLNTLFEPFNRSIKLFDSWVDGHESISNFHRCCDGIPDTVTILYSKENKHHIGGFNSEPWSSLTSPDWIKDKKAFLFSTNRKERYSVKQRGAQAVGCLKERGPCFGTDLGIDRDAKSGFSYFSSSYQPPAG